MKARVLVADPPWQMRDQLPGPKRGARKHYPTLTAGAIAGGVGFEIPLVANAAWDEWYAAREYAAQMHAAYEGAKDRLVRAQAALDSIARRQAELATRAQLDLGTKGRR